MQLEHILMAHGLIGRGGGKSKDEIPPPPVTNFKATIVGDSIKLTWTNPMDTDFVGVRIVRKVGSYPSSTSDGMIIYEGNLTTFTDDITLGVVHYYRAFTYDFDNNYNHDTGQQVSAIVKISQSAPSAPNITNLEHDRATITGVAGTEVRLGTGTWFDSPHVFTGLTAETTYQSYARMKETTTHYASSISSARNFTTPTEPKIYGVRIDKNNSNPNTRVTYIKDSIGFTPISGNNGNLQWGSWANILNDYEIKPCILNNTEVQYYLNPNDYTKKYNGTNSVLTGADGDVMIEFGKTLWTKWTDEGTTYTIEISDKEFEGAVKNAFEVEDGYNLVPYYPLLLTQILFVMLFKSTDSQTALGRGRVDGATGYANTGGTNAKGMFYGSTADEQMKFLGIEDYWGNKFWWIDGLVTDASYNILIGKSSFNDVGSGYISHSSGVSANISGYVNAVQGGNDKGFIIKTASGSETTYYADSGYLYSSRVADFGGDRSYGSNSGFARLRLIYSASYAYANVGARLFCAKNGKIYIGTYLGTTVAAKLRSISGGQPTGSKTIGTFRTEARANN